MDSPTNPVRFSPNFFKNFDIRLVSQSMFFSGGERPELLAWVRLEGLNEISPEVALLLIGDCLPPASTVCFKDLAPISSMNWTVDFSQPAQHSKWYLVRSLSLNASGGYSYQTMQVWNEHHELVLSGTQTVAIFT
ncbi:acyl-CoA thioesterase [Acinetobacter faecalis]|uniref:acyl-CoA thioesterase n=1 Tax=Acinetobacter faecalis TaxID=2665161 RepID=UPI002A91F778|nr:thioesterase family protein [Acinetobacter faecalis]MDY6456817.1 thioesterase family protein [Acinetobacter faecalis]